MMTILSNHFPDKPKNRLWLTQPQQYESFHLQIQKTIMGGNLITTP